MAEHDDHKTKGGSRWEKLKYLTDDEIDEKFSDKPYRAAALKIVKAVSQNR